MEDMINAPAAGEQNTQQDNTETTIQEGDGAGTPLPTGESAVKAEGQQSEKTFTQAELDAILQRRIADVKRSTEQRGLSVLAEREAELSQRERAIVQKELSFLAGAALQEKGLPVSLIGVMGLTTAEELPEQISIVETCFRETIEAEVTKRLRGSPPSAGIKVAGSVVNDPFLKGLHGELVPGYKTNINGKSVDKG